MSISEHEALSAVVGTAIGFADADGGCWRVTEHDCQGVPGARTARCLIFMSDCVFRRVSDYPAEWRTLSAPALTEVSWRR